MLGDSQPIPNTKCIRHKYFFDSFCFVCQVQHKNQSPQSPQSPAPSSIHRWSKTGLLCCPTGRPQKFQGELRNTARITATNIATKTAKLLQLECSFKMLQQAFWLFWGSGLFWTKLGRFALLCMYLLRVLPEEIVFRTVPISTSWRTGGVLCPSCQGDLLVMGESLSYAKELTCKTL